MVDLLVLFSPPENAQAERFAAHLHEPQVAPPVLRDLGILGRGREVVPVQPSVRTALEVGPGDDFRYTAIDAWRDEPARGAGLHATHAARDRDPELARRSLPSPPPVLSVETARALTAAIVVRQLSG